ncbi:cbb3-type cytochrome oxidase assembly protein CcoS [Aquibium sp. A9E412]|uniref:cbb3-type cytochrome oxidase assembly protein CcoS n=1 Tax=Aquibium sp. A9E412 TaxID=2976767 RepID=UPI0025B14923|nr:cbb3-type cytochrome oxidase assembly protein CcoS [Aquibium sp. A9E412]MDN2566307.1 cbb3-type cytochrome oxidase assembly protein CcoS [Aquibium sp. A9E412]
MSYLLWLVLVPIALGMGAVGLAAFLWSLRDGQYRDLDGAAVRVLTVEAQDRPLADRADAFPGEVDTGSPSANASGRQAGAAARRQARNRPPMTGVAAKAASPAARAAARTGRPAR